MPDIAVWNKCDNRCVMCTNMASFPAQDSGQYSLEWQVRKMERYLRGMGKTYLKNADDSGFVNLTGGEPTLHPDFLKLIAYFRRRLPGVNITLLTNGRRFADPDFARRFLRAAAPPFAVGIPVHAGTAALHDRIAGVKGSFSQTVKGLRALLAARGGPEVEIRLVLHRLNIKAFRGTLAFLRRAFRGLRPYRVTAIHYEIEGMSLANHRRLALRLPESASVIGAAAGLIAAFPDFRLYHFPLCLVPPALRAKCWTTLPREDRCYPAACRRCSLRSGCPGLMKEYRKAFGAEELRPVCS
ncbi:MAG: radical SAM protein [Elusimicrobiales bacterium]|nr:radical SAM protein [Elusimicrobiales bacterium]